MNSAKTIIALAGGILILMLGLLRFTKNTEKELYDKAFEMVMTQQGLTTSEEVMEHCPELKKVKRKMDQIGQMNSKIHSMTAGPASSVSENQSEEIVAMTHKIQMLRMDIKTELSQIMDTYDRSPSIEITALKQ